MAEFSKGDMVHVKADLFTRYMHLEKDGSIPPMWLEGEVTCLHRPAGKGRIRCLFRKPASIDGIVCGYSYVATGRYNSGSYDDPSSLTEDKRHTVIIVQPLGSGGSTRYLKPLTCREEDLEIIPQDHTGELSESKVLNNALLAKLDRVGRVYG